MSDASPDRTTASYTESRKHSGELTRAERAAVGPPTRRT